MLEVVEGTEVEIRCEAAYTGYKAPYLRWEDKDGDLGGYLDSNWERST